MAVWNQGSKGWLEALGPFEDELQDTDEDELQDTDALSADP